MNHTYFSTAGKRIASESSVRKIADGYYFTEGPVWSRKENLLYYTNFADNTIYMIRPGEQPVLFRRNSGRAVGLSIRKDGVLVAAETASHAVTLAYADHSAVIAEQYQGKMLNSPNDVIVRSDGAVLFTDPYSVAMGGPRELEFNGFYMVPFEKGVYQSPVLLGKMERPNGLAYSPDEQILYVNDTNHNLINSYARNSDDTVSYIGVFARLDETQGDGVADGMKVDTEGNVYVTGPGGIWVLSSSGDPLAILRFPEPVGNFCFGGADGRTLFAAATTSIYSMPVAISGLIP